MADDIDQMQDRLEYQREIDLYKSKRLEPSIKTPTGECLACGEPLTAARWCNADCRDLWELLEK